MRGGVNLVGHEVSTNGNAGFSDERKPTLITASTGNHGQSIAYAGRLFGARVIIYAPVENVNESKMQAMRDLGAEVRLHGCDFDEARLECERVARAESFRYVHSANEPGLIAGVGTVGLEIFEDLPDVDVIITPAGGGSCASGAGWPCAIAGKLESTSAPLVAIAQEVRSNFDKLVIPNSPGHLARSFYPLTIAPVCVFLRPRDWNSLQISIRRPVPLTNIETVSSTLCRNKAADVLDALITYWGMGRGNDVRDRTAHQLCRIRLPTFATA